MNLDPSTFHYLKPTGAQIVDMDDVRGAAAIYADIIQRVVPDSADRTYALRKLREVAMWVNIAITRVEGGAPRQD